MFMRSGLLLGALFLLAPGTASADGERPASGDWTGFYIGGNVGYGFADHDATLTVFSPAGAPLPTNFPLKYGLEPEGAFGGAQIGYNHQIDRIVLGVEADIQGSDINDRSTTSFVNPGNPNVISSFDYTAKLDVDWFGTVRGRLGYALENTLVYVTGGYAYGEVSYSALYDFPPPGPGQSFGTAKFNDTEDGYVLGAGIEHAFCKDFSLKFEYQYIDLGKREVEGQLFFSDGRPSGETFKTDVDADFHTLRVGINYKFGDRTEPIASLK